MFVLFVCGIGSSNLRFSNALMRVDKMCVCVCVCARSRGGEEMQKSARASPCQAGAGGHGNCRSEANSFCFHFWQMRAKSIFDLDEKVRASTDLHCIFTFFFNCVCVSV